MMISNSSNQKWLLFLTIVVVSFFLLASLAPPTKIDELSYVLPSLYHFDFFELPYQHIQLFGNVALLPSYAGKGLFGWNGIGLFNCLLCLICTWYLAEKRLFYFLFLLCCSLTIPINFISEGTTGLMYCITCWLTLELFEHKKHSPFIIGVLVSIGILLKLTTVFVAIALFSSLLLFRRYEFQWFVKVAVASICMLLIGSVDRVANGHNPLFPALILEHDATIAKEKTGIDFVEFTTIRRQKTKKSNQSFFYTETPLRAAIDSTFLSKPLYPVGLLLLFWGLFKNVLKRDEVLALLLTITLTYIIVIPDFRFSFGVLLGLNLLVLKRLPSLHWQFLPTRLFVSLASILTMIYLGGFVAVTVGLIDTYAFLKKSVGGYDVKRHYSEKLASQGDIIDFCFRGDFYYGSQVQPTFTNQNPDNGESVVEKIKKYPEVTFVCSRVPLDHPELTLEKRFENQALRGTRQPFRSPQYSSTFYIYRYTSLDLNHNE